VRWLKTSPAVEPHHVAITRADFIVLAQSFDLILPADSGGKKWIAFSMVALTAGTGVLMHCVRRPVQVAGCAVLACLLIAAQAATAYTRTSQLDEARAVADTFMPDSAGSLAIAGQQPAAPWLVLRAVFAQAVRERLLSLITAIFGLFAGVKSALAQLAPAPLTAEAHAYRLARRRRAAESEMEEAEFAAMASWRGDIEGELRQSELSIFREFLAEHAAKRRECFRALLDEAIRRSPAALAHVPERIIRIWLWPLQKVSAVALMVGGDLGIKTRTARTGAEVSETADLS
jgi:hypothetical protein